jgi:hypothetical protein
MVKDTPRMQHQQPGSTSPVIIDEDAIIERGFEIFLRRLRRGQPGDAISDRNQAEMELRQERARPS